MLQKLLEGTPRLEECVVTTRLLQHDLGSCGTLYDDVGFSVKFQVCL